MDSLTQIVLGAAAGEAVLGKKVGNKALLFGAIAGTMPDLDVLARFFTDTVTATEWHRGFSHSILFSILFAPILGWLTWKLLPKKEATHREWSWLMFAGLFTHPLLDAFTTWGTQLFWPFDVRLAFQSIFVIDPLYTVPFIIFLILVMRQKRTTVKRRRYNTVGLTISSTYLLLTLVIKGFAYQQFVSSLETQGIKYHDMNIRPAPFTTILWTANIDMGNTYLIGNYSFLDSQPITFKSYPKKHELLDDFEDSNVLQRLIHISEGWYTISKKEDVFYFNDLRFGLISIDPDEEQFAFSYILQSKQKKIVGVQEVAKYDRANPKQLLSALWVRIKGN